MGLFSKVGKGTVKTVADFPSWLGWETIKRSSKGLKDLAKNTFTIQKASRQETFEQAMQRLQLTEQDLQSRANHLLKQALIYLLISCLIFAYFIYLLINLHIVASILCLLVTSLFLVRTWAAHFWYFQIKRRKLGCTFKEWMQGTFGAKV